MATTVQVGFIGAGTVNFGGPDGPWDHASRLELIADLAFSCIIDPNTGAAQKKLDERLGGKYASRWTNCKVFANMEAMLEAGANKPTVMFIGVPPFCHGSLKKPMELQCLEAGIHCFVEKPLSNATGPETMEYAQAIEKFRATADNKKLQVSIGYMFRHSKWAKYMKDLVKTHGKPVVCFNAQYTCAYANIASPFWWNSVHSGGPIIEQATHFVDLARYLVGEVVDESIFGWGVTPSEEPNTVGHLEKIPASAKESEVASEHRVSRSTVLNWQFATGAVGSLVHGALLQGDAYDARLEIICDGLRIRVEEPYSAVPRLHILQGKNDKEQVIEFPNDDPYLTEDQEFIDAVRATSADKDATPHLTCDYTDGAKTYALSYAMHKRTKKSPVQP